MAIELGKLEETLGGELPPNLEVGSQEVEIGEGNQEIEGTEVQNPESGAVEQELLEAAAIAKPAEELVVVEAPPKVEDPKLKSIEKMLAKGLDSVFKDLQERGTAEAFKAKGEEIALTFRAWIVKKAFNEADVFEQVESWLKLIDGVNAYFLLQESKRKSDAITRYLQEEIAKGDGETI